MTTYFILVGQPASGKKSLLNRLHGNKFTQSHVQLISLNTTRGVNVSHHNQTHILQFEGHDLGGRFESITDNQGKLRGKRKVLICIDVHTGLQQARAIIKQSLKRLDIASNSGGTPILVFTKCDSIDRSLSDDDINILQSEYKLEVIHTDASRSNVASEFFNDLFEKVNIAPAHSNADNLSAKERFIAEHRNLYHQSRTVCFFGFFRRSRVNYDASLGDIIRHAQLSNNRSRQAFVNLGWMRRDGSIISSEAPDEVNEALCFENGAGNIDEYYQKIRSDYSSIGKKMFGIFKRPCRARMIHDIDEAITKLENENNEENKQELIELLNRTIDEISDETRIWKSGLKTSCKKLLKNLDVDGSIYEKNVLYKF